MSSFRPNFKNNKNKRDTEIEDSSPKEKILNFFYLIDKFKSKKEENESPKVSDIQ